MTGYWDIVIVLGIASVMLLVLDWRINRAFIMHEKREAVMVAEVALSSDTALALVREGQRQVRQLQSESTLHGVSINNLTEEIRMHDRRIGIVEERILRAGLVVPMPKRDGGND